MKRKLPFLIVVSTLAVFDACVTDSKSSGTDSTATPSLQSGARKPRTPKVTYNTFDSLIYITIVGSAAGEEDEYWIYRDGKLLDQPDHVKTDSADLYTLRDSVSVLGPHTYYVQYGKTSDSLSDKSPDYVFRYSGHSPSGLLRVTGMQGPLVEVRIAPPLNQAVSEYNIERKMGSDGKASTLDTILFGQGFEDTYLDTNLVAEDTVLYYRARALDAVSETFLDPTPWDSVQIKNKVWNYVPSISINVAQAGVAVAVTNALGFSVEKLGYYFLFRNATGSKDGKVLVDSVPIAPAGIPLALHDQPDSGDYYYWVAARDPWGRTSARSVPRLVHFTGRPQGPDISSLVVGQTFIQIQPSVDPDAQLYILERAQDTAKAIKILDTLAAPLIQFPQQPAFYDLPPQGGYYSYRILTVRTDGAPTDPGAWKRADYFQFNPSYSDLDATIVNRGNRVEAPITRSADAYYTLYRSKTANGKDTAAVATLKYSDTSSTLRDAPAPGTWYYRVYRYPATGYSGGGISRSKSTRIDFTGKPVGPAVVNLTVYPTRIGISFTTDPDALAYIVERSADGKEWTVADTLSNQDANAVGLYNRPPADGFWNYRLRTVGKDLSVSDPGTANPATVSFTYVPDNGSNQQQPAAIVNLGTKVSCAIFNNYGYTTYLIRGTEADISKGTAVDSLSYSSSTSVLTDRPPKGTYYYWTAIVSVYAGGSTPVSHSAPVKIDFSGAPDLTALSATIGGVQITYPSLDIGDSSDIFRSTGKPDDLASFTLLASVESSGFIGTYVDTSAAKASGFYHYRLALRTNGKDSDLGVAMSIYYEPLKVQF